MRGNKLFKRVRASGSIKDILWMFAEKMLSMAGALFSGILVARYLGPSQAGVINVAYGVQGIMLSMAGLGLESVVIRRFATAPSELDKTRDISWSILSLTGAIGAVGMILYAILSSDGYQSRMALAAAALPLLFLRGQVIEWVFRSNSNGRKLTRLRIVVTILMQVAKVVLVLCNASFELFVGAIAVDSLLAYAIYYIAAHIDRVGLPSLVRMKKPDLASLLGESWPLLATGLAVMIYSRGDVIMLKMFKGETEVGIYSAATRLCELWYMIPGVVCTGFYAEFTKAHATDPEKFARYSVVLTWLFVACSVSVSILTALFGGEVVRIIYGSKYQGAAEPLKLVVWVLVPVFVGYLLLQYCMVWRYTKEFLVGCVAGAVGNIVLNLLWIPAHGASGSALATSLSYWLSIVVPLAISKKLRTQVIELYRDGMRKKSPVNP